MSRVLRDASFGQRPRLVAFGASPGLPEAVQALIASAAAEAFEQGRQEGREQGLADAARRAEALARPVAAALAGGAQELRRIRDAAHEELLELALTIARAVTGADPGPGGRRLLDDVTAALAALDDGALVVVAHPDDRRLLAEGLAAVPGVTVVADAALCPGEALVRGPWSRAEVTRAATWSVVAEALGLAEPGAGGPPRVPLRGGAGEAGPGFFG